MTGRVTHIEWLESDFEDIMDRYIRETGGFDLTHDECEDIAAQINDGVRIIPIPPPRRPGVVRRATRRVAAFATFVRDEGLL